MSYTAMTTRDCETLRKTIEQLCELVILARQNLKLRSQRDGLLELLGRKGKDNG